MLVLRKLNGPEAAVFLSPLSRWNSSWLRGYFRSWRGEIYVGWFCLRVDFSGFLTLFQLLESFNMVSLTRHCLSCICRDSTFFSLSSGHHINPTRDRRWKQFHWGTFFDKLIMTNRHLLPFSLVFHLNSVTLWWRSGSKSATIIAIILTLKWYTRHAITSIIIPMKTMKQ